MHAVGYGQPNYQGYNYFYKHGDAVTLDSNRGGQFIAGNIRIPFYQTSDTTMVLGIDSHGMIVLRKNGGSGTPGSGTMTSLTAAGYMLGGTVTTSGTFTPDTSAGKLATKTNLALKLNLSDTASMLATYAKTSAIPSVTGKLNISDTAAMLSPYERSAHASAIYATIANLALKVAIADTANMLSPYLHKADSNINTGYAAYSYLTNNFYNRTQSDARYLQSYTVDSAIFSTKGYRQKGIDSVTHIGYLLTESDPIATAKTVTIGSGYGITGGGAAQALNANPARTLVLDTAVVFPAVRATVPAGTTYSAGYGISGTTTFNVDSAYIATRLRLQKVVDSLSVIIATKGTGNGTVTSVANGYGTNGGTITTSGSIGVDTALIATRLRVQKQVDSLGVIIATKGTGNGTVTSVGNGYGVTGGTITTSGNLGIDTAYIATRLRVQKQVDSLNVLIAAKGTGTVTSVTVNSVSPLFTSSTSNNTTTPTTTFSLISQSQNLFYASPNGSSGNPSFRAIAGPDLPADNAYTDVAQSFTKGQAGTPVTLTDASTVNIDLATGNNFRVTLGGNRTLGVPTNIVAGQTGYINIWQDITGSRTLSLPWPYSYSGATAPTLSTGKLAMDKLVYAVDYYSTSSAITCTTTGANAIFTLSSHGYIDGQMIQFSAGTTTTPALNTTYWIRVINSSTFNLCTSFANAQAGTYITSSGTSGSLTATVCGISTALNTDFRR